LYGLLGGFSEEKKYFTGGKPGNDLYYKGKTSLTHKSIERKRTVTMIVPI